ncbi:hypothetical protein ACXN5S_09555 [Pseudoroseicyclus sp. H15]
MDGTDTIETSTYAEKIRLVIWDLDETFWQGTLEEGDITIPPENIEIVKTLAKRGIVSSICSKNDMARVKARLEQDGLWEWFVFPAVGYSNKSGMIQATIEAMGLRAPSVLFLDDNSFNRGEARELVPGLNVDDESVIPTLLDHPNLKGKPDEEMSRLDRYRILQTKHDAITTSDAPMEFLRSCEIRVSFHFDILDQFDRIHDLVNRTNQLNFTKNRWDEDVNVARAAYEKDVRDSHTNHAVYVKVRDKYGYYGICGFYETVKPNRLRHFLFSCRALNMGVEQFVYQQIMFPPLKIAEPVAGKLEKETLVDWITVVEDAEAEETPQAQSDLRVCLHGPCELAQSTHYLRPYFRTEEEFQYPSAGWGIKRPMLRNLILKDELAEARVKSKKALGLSDSFAGIDFAAFGSQLFEGGADVLVWSFSLEQTVKLYRNKRTGLVFPISIDSFNSEDFTTYPFEEVAKVRPVAAEQYAEVAANFDYVGEGVDLFQQDLAKLRAKLEATSKPMIVIDLYDDVETIDRAKYRQNGEINRMVHAALDGCPLVHFVSMRDCVTGKSDEVGINHFKRDVYVALADLIRAKIAEIDPVAEAPAAAPETASPEAKTGLVGRLRGVISRAARRV